MSYPEANLGEAPTQTASEYAARASRMLGEAHSTATRIESALRGPVPSPANEINKAPQGIIANWRENDMRLSTLVERLNEIENMLIGGASQQSNGELVGKARY